MWTFCGKKPLFLEDDVIFFNNKWDEEMQNCKLMLPKNYTKICLFFVGK